MSAQEMPLWGEHSQGVTAHVVTLTDEAVWHSFQDFSKLERNSSEDQNKPTLGQLNIKFAFRCFKNGFPTATIRAQNASGRIYLNFIIEVKPKPYQFSHLNTSKYCMSALRCSNCLCCFKTRSVWFPLSHFSF